MNETEDILKALDDKEPEKKPSNWALWSALYFAEAVFVVLDAVSAITVGYITGFWYYGLFVFMAGVIPLYLYTKQFTRPLASPAQRRLAMWGGICAVVAVILIAAIMASINVAGAALVEKAKMEARLVIGTILVLAVHGFIMGRYFFMDEQIREDNRSDRMVAAGDRGIRRIGIANKVAAAKKQEVGHRKDFERRFDPRVLARILDKLQDVDEDGIPDFIDPIDNRTGKPFEKTMSYAKDDENPTNRQR